MADTQGFSVVVEASERALRKVMRGAWKSAECPEEPGDEGRIPEFMQIEPGTSFGDYVVADGTVQIPQDELDATLRPDITGAEIKLGIQIDVEIENPPVPSAQLFSMTADVRVAAPIGLIPGTQDVGWLLDGLPRGSVTATLSSGDPIADRIELFAGEFIDKAYENGGPDGPIDPAFPSIPHVRSETDIAFAGGALVADVHTEIFNDPGNLAHRIETTIVGGTLNISIPIYLRIFDILVSDVVALFFTPADPMGIETRIVIAAPFARDGDRYLADLAAAVVSVDPIAPAGPEYGDEGANYTNNKAQLASIPFIPIDLDAQLQSELKAEGEQLAQDIGTFEIAAPTVAQIEEFIGDLFHADLEPRNFIYIWGPEATDEDFEVNDITVDVLPGALVIALNETGGGSTSALVDFIPADRDFAIAISRAQIDASIETAREESELSDGDLPKRFEADGRDVDLKDLDVTLIPGAIRMTGKLTVIDAILGSIDVDADFTADVGLRWEPNGALGPDGGQNMVHFEIFTDVDPEESVLLWVLTAILAVISFGAFGLLGGLVVIIVALVVRGIAESMGSSVLADEITDTVSGITGWPENLSRIGRVEAVFFDPIDIQPDGLTIAGDFEVISSCEATAVVPADSGGSYTGSAASALTLSAGNLHPDAGYDWLPGDGAAASVLPEISHVYAASGIYVAKHGLKINQLGGAASRSFALVSMANVPPTINVGPDITVKEGEVVTLTAWFRDVEYPDTHESMWYFGDAQAPEPGELVEINAPPEATGTTTVSHAWCDNGEYTVTVRLRDVNGGEALDNLRVTVLNVPPEVEAGPDMYAYVCMAVTLTAHFTDPGWCDTHRAQWDFGDCTEPQTAIVDEVNEPPATVGTAVASHIYARCGDYRAVCTVRDDDDGIGQSMLTVRVVHLLNSGFEDGFRDSAVGRVGRFWTSYAALTPIARLMAGKGVPSSAPDDVPIPARAFACEECVVHSGDSSQRVAAPAGRRVGIWQRLGANPGWDYQVSAWFGLLDPFAGGYALGIDPLGGEDPEAPQVVWSVGRSSGPWRQLSGRVTARSEAVTIYVEIVGTDNRLGAQGCIDDVEFVAIQPHCPSEPEGPDKPESQQEERCIDFRRIKAPSRHPTLSLSGVSFMAESRQVLRVVGWGVPEGTPKLLLTLGGVVAMLPLTADKVGALVSYLGGKPVRMEAYDAAGNRVGVTTGTGQQGLQTLEITTPGIVRVRLAAQEGLLCRLCFWAERPGGAREVLPRGTIINARFDRLSPQLSQTEMAEDSDLASQSEMRARFGLSEAGWERLDAGFRTALARDPSLAEAQAVKVMVLLAGDGPTREPAMRGATRVDERQAEFRREVKPVVDILRRAGARDVEHLWLVRGIAATMPARAAIAVAEDARVRSIVLATKQNALPENRN